MTLVGYVIDVLQNNWPGGVPSDVEFVNAHNKEVLSGPIRQRAKELEGTVYVGVRHTQRDSERGGVAAGEQREAVLQVQVEGLHEDKYGAITDDQEFRDLVRDSKEAIRAVSRDPDVGSDHPATWHRVRPHSEFDGSGAYGDYYQTVYDVTLLGHE